MCVSLNQSRKKINIFGWEICFTKIHRNSIALKKLKLPISWLNSCGVCVKNIIYIINTEEEKLRRKYKKKKP